MKYAFPENREGKIYVSLSESKDQLVLLIKDDGVGMSDANLKGDSNSLGYKMINSFVDRLDGKIDIANDNETSVSITIKEYKKVK